MAERALGARGAGVQLGGRWVWRDVELDVPSGEFVAILGSNGAGKSTLIKAALGILPLSAGTLEVLGRPPGRAGDLIGYLPQRRSFDRDLRVRGVDVVRLGLDGHRWGLPVPGRGRSPARTAARRRVEEVIDLVGGASFAGRPIGEISGGEQQRLLIAQALARRPRLLILDEPLDGLDLPNQGAISGLIADISRQEQVTVVMVAHDVNPILPYVDRVIYLAPGGVMSGPPAAVITSDALSRIYGAPIEVLQTADGRFVVVGHPDAPAHHYDRHTGTSRS